MKGLKSWLEELAGPLIGRAVRLALPVMLGALVGALADAGLLDGELARALATLLN